MLSGVGGTERGDCCILVGNLGTQHIDSRILFGNSRNELVDRSSSRRLVPFIVPSIERIRCGYLYYLHCRYCRHYS
jgi:hypothetical protein